MKKNYFKLIGSILMVLCMVVTVGLVTIGAKAEDTPTASVEWRADVTYEEDNKAPETPGDLSGYIFGGWYKNTGSAEAPVYTPVREPVLKEKYVAKWVPAEVLGIQAQISNNIVKEDTETKTKNKIRFVTSIDATAYSKIGFEIKKGDGTAEIVDTTNKVFSKLYYIDAASASEEPQSVDAGSLFCQGVSQYFKTYTITSIPDTAFDTDITVRPYWDTLDGTRVFGAKAIKTVNYGRSWYYVDAEANAVTNSEAPFGTYSKPYTTLASAVAVETKLNPKLILKSDIEITETVNVTRTMTIAGYESAKTITKKATDTDNYIFNVQSTGDITLNDLHLSGGERAIQNTGGAFTATNVEILGCTGMCIRLDGGTANLTNVTTTGGTRGLQLYSSAEVTGNNVKIYGPTAHGIACGGASKLNITNLTIDGTIDGENKLTSHAMNVYGSSEVTVTNGNIQNIKNIHGVNAGICKVTLNEVNITYDSTSSANLDGINAYYEESAEGSADVNLNNVTINNAPRYGIHVSGGSEVTGNTVTIVSSVQSGIKCTGSGSKFDITTLNVLNSKSHGVELTEEGTGSISGGTISNSAGKGIYLHKEAEDGVTGATITLENYNINNSTGENLYLNNTSSATVNGTLATNGGNTHSFAIYNASTLTKGDNYSKIEINSPGNIGVRIYNSGSKLDVADMEITGGTNGIEMDTGTTVNLAGNVSLSNMIGSSDDVGNGIFLKYGGTLNATNATISIDKVGFNAVYIKSGTFNADTSTINITGGCNYGFRANGGTAKVGELNIDGASAWSAVYIQGNATNVTINGGIIQNINKHGVNVKTKATLTMKNCTVIDIGLNISDGHEIINECKYAIIILENCNISTGDIYPNTANCKCTEE